MYVDKNGIVFNLKTPEQINEKLIEVSPEWKSAMKAGKKVTLTMYSCNTGSNKFLQHANPNYNVVARIIPNPNPIAQQFSKKYPNVTVIAPEGYVLYGAENGKYFIAGLSNDATKPNWRVYQNGEIITKTYE